MKDLVLYGLLAILVYFLFFSDYSEGMDTIAQEESIHVYTRAVAAASLA